MDLDTDHPNAATLPVAGPCLDVERYLPEIEGKFESEEAAAEFLRTLWEIMCAFVDLGWGVDSIHFVIPELAQISSGDPESAVGSHDQHIDEEFAAATEQLPERESL